MLSPKRTKHRKTFKNIPSTLMYSDNQLSFGSFALKSLDFARLTAKQIEAARRAITRKLKRKGKLWIKVFPHTPVTGKPTEVRMGKGKGSLSYWCCPLKPGTLLFELDGVSLDLAKEALSLGANKLPFQSKFIVNYTNIK
jgi:large subunit ribosomal protein L16